MKKKVLFVVNNNPIDPLGIMYLISNTQNAEFDVKFTPGLHVDASNYDIIGFSTITGSHLYHNDLAYFYKLKNPKVITIMGGSHPTFFPKECEYLEYIDYICRGEGVIAFNKWINGEETNNITKNNNYKFNNILDPLCDINKIEFPDRCKVYTGNRYNNPIRNFIGIEGCPFNCTYCYNKSFADLYHGQPRLRFKDPELYIQEIIKCTNIYPTKLLYFQEDTFICNKKWFIKLTDLIKSKVNKPYHCHVRCDLLNEDIVIQLKNTGCKSVTFAIENGDDFYRRIYLNRNMTDEKILKSVKLLHKYNIKFRIENMVCLPYQDLKGDLKTLELNYKCNPTVGWASIFQPFPNTQLGEWCKRDKLWNGDIDNINSGFFDKSSIKISNSIERERLQKLFPLACEYKLIKYLIKFLIKLPLDNFYKKLYITFKEKKYKELYDI